MRTFIHQAVLCAASTAFVLFGTTAHAQGGIVFNPTTGSYTITYQGDGGMSETTYIPTNQIAPSVQSVFRLMENKAVSYRYNIANGATAKLAIEIIHIEDVPNLLLGEIRRVELVGNETNAAILAEGDARYAAMNRAMSTPPNWMNFIDRGHIGEPESIISWSSDDEKGNPGILPGGRVSGFGFASLDLPGIMFIKLEALGSGIVYADEGPAEDDPITKQIDQLRDNDFIAKPAAVPTIAVPVPFDAALLLDRIRTHVAAWPSKQLLDPALATQLDRYLVSAADAYRRNQLKVGKEHIETLREMLKREHKDLDHDDDENENGKHAEKNDDHRAATQRILIDRLAARILDFDLKYVLKRTEREDDEYKKH
jgi:hypothetical protein